MHTDGVSEDGSIEIAEATLAVLASSNVALDEGLSAEEISAAEERVGSLFPPDLVALLRRALPTGDEFPNWRDPDNPQLNDRLDQPINGIVFDVLHNGFWHPDWPERPDDVAKAESIARAALSSAPKLIPVYAHRYLPSEPLTVGNPVLSVWQTDIIFYGANLADYARNEFQSGWQDPGPTTALPFWDYILFND